MPLNFYLNNENIVTGKPKETFDSRKTKTQDDDYVTLYDQLVSEWETERQLLIYDNKVIITPKAAMQNSSDHEGLEHPDLYSFEELKA